MRDIHFDPGQRIPIIDARILGPRRAHRLQLVFDTGSQFTIIDTQLIEDIGFTARDSSQLLSITDVTGASQDGFLIEVPELRFLGLTAQRVSVGAFDFEHFDHYGAHGLLGWDAIRRLHVELDGPNGLLKVFDS